MKFIPVNEPLLNGNEKKYLNECIDSGWISSEGPFVEKFEKKFSEKIGRRYGIAVSSGTAAIDIAIETLNLQKNDEVIVPTFTIISCLNHIVRKGIKPILVDCDLDTWNINVKEIEKKITNKTKAIMVVHIYGMPVDLNPILLLSKKYNLKIIEDAAEVIGQKYYEKYCGSFGDISIFSFYPNKHITTGEGGMVMTDNYDYAVKAKKLRNLCFSEIERFKHFQLGWNYRMTNLQAALGLAQLERLDEFIKKKRHIGNYYNELFNDTTLQLPKAKLNYAENIYWVYAIVLDEKQKIDAITIIEELKKMGIGCRSFFYPMHLQPIFHKMGLFINEKYPNSEKLYSKGFYIPSGLAISDEQIETVANCIKSVIKN